MWQNVAYTLIGIGVLVLIGWAVKDFFLSGDIPLLLRIAAGVIGIGMLILLGIAVKDRLGKKDEFKEVEH
jgi:uncharacterized membrane protein YuzA (DUF378 family)